MYSKLKQAVLDRNNEIVEAVYNEIKQIDKDKLSSDEFALNIWMEAICLMNISYVEEVDIYYKECIELINKALDSKRIEDRLARNKLLCTRVRCVDELFHFGEYPGIELTRDRLSLLDDILHFWMFKNGSSERDCINMMNIFLNSGIVDHLHNAKNDAVYGFLMGQEALVYKLLYQIYKQQDDDDKVGRVAQCLYATFENLNRRIEEGSKDFVVFNEEAKSYKEIASLLYDRKKVMKNVAWDIVTLGMKL